MTEFKEYDKVRIVKVYDGENHRLDGREGSYVKKDEYGSHQVYLGVAEGSWWCQEVKAISSKITEPTTVGAVVEDSDGDLWVRDSDGTWFSHPDSLYTFENWSWERLNEAYPVAHVVSGHESTVDVKDVVAALDRFVGNHQKEIILNSLGVKPTKKVVRATIEIEVDEDDQDPSNLQEHEQWTFIYNLVDHFTVESFEVIEK